MLNLGRHGSQRRQLAELGRQGERRRQFADLVPNLGRRGAQRRQLTNLGRRGERRASSPTWCRASAAAALSGASSPTSVVAGSANAGC